ncbi:MAG: hypothetical protein ACREDH_02290, partial [Methylocella sp.]
DGKRLLFVTGFDVSVCVLDTIRHALNMNYRVVLLDDGVNEHWRAREFLQQRGVIVEDSKNVLKFLASHATAPAPVIPGSAFPSPGCG